MSNQLNKMYGGEFFTLTIPITGNCNFQCEFCAYQHNMGLLEWFPINLFEKILQQVNDLQRVVRRQLIINFSGGEPTIDLSRLQKYVSIARSYLNDNIKLAIISNGSFAKEMSKIEMLNQMAFNFIKVTLSRCHYLFQKEQDLINLANIIKNLWWMGVDDNIEGKNIQKLYANLFSEHPDIPLIILSERKITKKMQKLMLFPTKQPCIRRLKPDGIYCFASGEIGPECPGMGNEFSCKLGTIEDLILAGKKIVEAGMNVHLNARTMGENIQSVFHPACLQMRQLGIPNTCFDTKAIEIWAEGSPPKTYWEVRD